MKILNKSLLAGGTFLFLNFLTFSTLAAPTYRIYATREGLVGGRTASGHIIQSRDHFCALPSGTVLNCNGCYNYTVNIRYPGNGRVVTGVPVWDVGPWNTKDNYWHVPRAEFGNVALGVPEAQAAYQNGYNGGRDEFGRSVSNPAGIDLADGTFWDSLGMVNNDWVEVTYNWEPNCNYSWVQGAIKAHYDSLGACGSFLGGPTTTEQGAPDGIGRYNHFQNSGSIYWTSVYGAWSIHGLIRDRWQALGWEAGILGYPVTDETGTPDGIGRFNHFKNPRLNDQGGSIYWTANYGAWSINGAIRDKWSSLGWEASVLGYPVTDETKTPDGIGRYNHFKNPRLSNQGGSIYWTPTLGAHEVHGLIRDFWANQGWESGPLGYPTSDEYAVPQGRRSNFEHGTVTWNSSNNQTTSP
ncbi:MAG: repeat protein [Pedosphaera sp.]|nr:repeat protein [Pedosphaera sp.]